MTLDDQQLIDALKQAGIIVPLRKELIELDDGVILIACGDCDKFPSLKHWLNDLFRERGKEPRIHLIILNGGGALIPSESRVGRNNEGSIMTFHIQQACRLRNISIVLDATHFECGAAAEANVNLRTLLRYKVLSKRRIKRDARSVRKVYSLLHIHYPDKRDRTYVVRTKELSEYLRRTAAPQQAPKRRRAA